VTTASDFRACAIAFFTHAANAFAFVTIWSAGKNPTTVSSSAPATPTPSATAAPVSRRIGSPTTFA
jgi:hypothetical protein